MTLPLLLVLAATVPIYLFGIHYFRHARRAGRYKALMFLLAIAYGISLEHFAIRTTESYEYAFLLLMVGGPPHWVPLAVGISWACIIYLAMRTSDLLQLPTWLRPLFDGTLAVVIDLVMDPVTSNSRWVDSYTPSCAVEAPGTFGGVGLWTWCLPAGHQNLWFNVPLSNYFGWFMVVAALSLFIRLGGERLNGEGRPLSQQIPLGIALTGAAFLTLYAVMVGIFHILAAGLVTPRLLFILVVLGPTVLVAFQARRLQIWGVLDVKLLLLPLFVFVAEPLSFVIKGMDREAWPAAIVQLMSAVAYGVVLLLLPCAGTLLRIPRPRGSVETE